MHLKFFSWSMILISTDHTHKRRNMHCFMSSWAGWLSHYSVLYFTVWEHDLYVCTFCCQTQNGGSPVYAASQNGHIEVVDLLVQAGADINLATTKVHVNTHTVFSSIAAVVETNVRFIEFAAYDLYFH